MDMKVKDFDSYKIPNRKPWALLVALVLVAVVAYFIFFRADSEKASHSDLTEIVADSDDGASVASSAVVEDSGSVESAIPATPILPKVIPTGDIAMVLDQASQLASDERLAEARAKYLVALKSTNDKSIQRQIEQKLAAVNIKMLLSPREMPEKENYLVKNGNSLDRIARKYGTTVDLIQKSNMLRNPNRINVGDRLRVFTGKFSMTCSKSRHDIVVFMNGDFFKRYMVGTGRYGKTPTGTFNVREKIKEPPWWRPDGSVVPFGNKEDNILGTRWFSLRATGETEDVRGYGIHGTWSPESVGTASSAGCLRMKNEEVEELFIYIPLGTPVTIVE